MNVAKVPELTAWAPLLSEKRSGWPFVVIA